MHGWMQYDAAKAKIAGIHQEADSRRLAQEAKRSTWKRRYSYCRFWDASRLHAAWHATFPAAHRREHNRKLGAVQSGKVL